MDPITHGVIGAAISNFAGNEIALSDAATVSMVIGSMFPDIDIVFQKWGDYVYLKNHRGLTHSIFGLIASSAVLAVVLSLFYSNYNIYGLFLWSFVGGLSHTIFDIFNSYGAKLLWPFTNKKFSLSLLNIFDPVFFLALIGYIAAPASVKSAFLVVFFAYLVLRVIMRWVVSKELNKKFGSRCNKISLLPSMTGLFRWHFVLEERDCNIVGEKSVLKHGIRIFKRLDKVKDDVLNKVLVSYVGKFFCEFTPIYHVMCENVGDVTRYILVDMRYYLRKSNNFLHHAVLEMDKNDDIITASFNAYSMKRASIIPDPDCSPNNTFLSKLVGM